MQDSGACGNYHIVMTRPATEDSCKGGVAPLDGTAALARHERWLRTVVLARLGEPQAVEDVLQEVALATVGQAALPVEPSKWAPWLYRVAVRQALLHRRKEGRRRKLADRYARAAGRQACPESAYDPLRLVVADERCRMVREALAGLRRKDVEILLLKYTEGWSYRDLAGHLGVSESAVETRLHRARARLRRELAALQMDEERP